MTVLIFGLGSIGQRMSVDPRSHEWRRSNRGIPYTRRNLVISDELKADHGIKPEEYYGLTTLH